MPAWRQVMTGLIMAVVFCLILLGSISLSMAEGGFQLALAPSPTTGFPEFPTLPPTVIVPIIKTPIVASETPSSTPTPIRTVYPTLTHTPTETYSPSADCLPPSGWVGILVLPGDTLSSLAFLYSIPVESLSMANCLSVDSLAPGSIIYVPNMLPPPPPPTIIYYPTPTSCYLNPWGWIPYIVRYGDTLISIGGANGVTVSQLMFANCLSSTEIYAGQLLYVPYRPPTPIPYYTPTFTATYWWPYYTSTPTYWYPPSATTTSTPTRTFTPTPSATRTLTNSQTPTYTMPPTNTPTMTPIPASNTPSPTGTPSPTITNTPVPPYPYP
jgi:LysM repeat protein